tara:strand:- start:689 stop:1243 length:555 start_codon:yes stop_codon:yes gene_type:complete
MSLPPILLEYLTMTDSFKVTIEIDHDTFDLAANHEAACTFGSWRGGGFYVSNDDLQRLLNDENGVMTEGFYLFDDDWQVETRNGLYTGISWKKAEELYRRGENVYTICIDHTEVCYDDFFWDADFQRKSCQATKINKQTVTEAFNKIAAKPDWWVCKDIIADNADSICWDCLFQYIDYGDVIYG